MIKEKGITLIALVITIIVLIILTGVSIALLLGENGLILKAKEAKYVMDVAKAQEKLELIKGSAQIEKQRINLDDYLEELEKVKEINKVDDIERIDNINAEVIVDGKYKFVIKDEENGDVKIIYQGETSGLVLSATSGEYRYPTTGTFEVVKNISGGEMSVKSENEDIAKTTISGKTITVIPQNVAGTVKIIVTSAAKGNYEEKQAIYIATIKNDNIEPSSAKIEITGNTSSTKLPVTLNAKVTHTDNESGINIKECKYILNESSDEIGTDSSKYTNGNFNSNDETITLPLKEVKNYYLHVLSVDNVGNAKETIKGPIGVTAKTHVHTGSKSSYGGCYTKENTWTSTCTAIVSSAYHSHYDYGSQMTVIGCSNGHWHGTNMEGHVCGFVTTHKDGYSLNCGKTTSTIEGYNIKY